MQCTSRRLSSAVAPAWMPRGPTGGWQRLPRPKPPHASRIESHCLRNRELYASRTPHGLGPRFRRTATRSRTRTRPRTPPAPSDPRPARPRPPAPPLPRGAASLRHRLPAPAAARRALAVRANAIAVGDKLPDSKFRYFDGEGNMKEVTTDQLAKGKKVVLFAVPGAFTPTCSMKHLPGFIEKADEIKVGAFGGEAGVACSREAGVGWGRRERGASGSGLSPALDRAAGAVAARVVRPTRCRAFRPQRARDIPPPPCPRPSRRRPRACPPSPACPSTTRELS